jgi:hypothetical protein
MCPFRVGRHPSAFCLSLRHSDAPQRAGFKNPARTRADFNFRKGLLLETFFPP